MISSSHHLSSVAAFAQAADSKPHARARLGHHGWATDGGLASPAAKTASDAAPAATEAARRLRNASQWCNERGVVGAGAAPTMAAESQCSASSHCRSMGTWRPPSDDIALPQQADPRHAAATCARHRQPAAHRQARLQVERPDYDGRALQARQAHWDDQRTADAGERGDEQYIQ